MTNEEINLTIAKSHLGVFPWESKKGTVGGWTNDDGDDCEAPPDYCNDLDAMHEAEKTLSEEQWENYNFILCNLVGGYSKTNKEAIHASSRQKAEAFLEAIIYKNNT